MGDWIRATFFTAYCPFGVNHQMMAVACELGQCHWMIITAVSFFVIEAELLFVCVMIMDFYFEHRGGSRTAE